VINFEEELKKFRPSPEIYDMEDRIYHQDLDDMADVIVKIMRESQDGSGRFGRRM